MISSYTEWEERRTCEQVSDAARSMVAPSLEDVASLAKAYRKA